MGSASAGHTAAAKRDAGIGETIDAAPSRARVNRIGHLYLLGTVVLNGSAWHLIRAGLKHCPPATAVVVFSYSAAAGILGAGLLCRLLNRRIGGFHAVTPRSAMRRLARQAKALIPATVVGMFGGWLGVTTIGLYGPSVAAFLSNQTLVYLVGGGVLLGDRLSSRESAYVVAVLAGAFMFAYTDDSMAWLALGLMGLSCLCTAIKQIVIKDLASNGSLWDLMAAQQALMGTWALMLAAGSGKLVLPPVQSALPLVASGILQNFLGMSLLYAGYRKVGIARGAPIYAMRPLMVLLIGLLIGVAVPSPVQLVGGMMVLGGSVLLTRHEPRRE